MPDFGPAFAASRGAPIQYKGRTLVLADSLAVTQGAIVRVVLKSTSSQLRQGVGLRSDGRLRFGNVVCKPRQFITLWADTMPQVAEVRCEAGCTYLQVKNIWESPSGRIDSWHNGAAMIIETIRDGKLYRCNDGEPDEDFDDIVFKIEYAR